MRRVVVILLIVGWVAAYPAAQGEGGREDPRWLLPVPELDPDPRVPTLEMAVGHRWADAITPSADIERYLHALVDAAPGRARIESYGETYEGRKLHYVVISAPENIRRLEDIRKDNLRLADPRTIDPQEAARLMESAPAFLWLAASIHGNETSSSEALMLTAYHLLADRRRETARALQNVVVFIDPLENPDGRERFINSYREMRGVFPQSEPLASERTERWPSGRFNHYLFDMNRDWFLHSQVETRGRVAAYLHWRPHIYVDAHEMGHNANYYFAPAADPINPHTLPRQRRWLHRMGKHQASWFDRYGFAYTTREIFDAFYPGYGSEWPNLHGVMGILWEQAGVRGLVVRREDATMLRFHDAVRHHYVSALATVEVAWQHRRELLEDYHDSLRRGILLGEEGPVRDVFVLEGKRPTRASRLAGLLVRNGVEVRRLRAPLRVTATDVHDDAKRDVTIPGGTYHLSVAQPAGRAIRVLLDRHVAMGEDFVARQLERKARRLGDEIYDVTAWSLPLSFGVECLQSAERVEVPSVPWDGSPREGRVVGGRASVAYLVSGEDDGSLLALSAWLREGHRVHVADRALSLGGVEFPRGTLVLKVHENSASLHGSVEAKARLHGLDVHATDTGFVASGAHLGGPHVKWVRPPEVLLLVDRPARYSVGHTWYLFDRVLEYPVTRVAGRNLGRVELDRYNVLILPDGDYQEARAPGSELVARIREWVGKGGTLVLVGGAASWATGEDVGLLASAQVTKETPWKGEAVELEPPATESGRGPGPSGSSEKAHEEEDADEDEDRETLSEPPDAVPGAFLRAAVYDDHWVTFGCGPRVDVLLSGNRILRPLRPTDGRNLVVFVENDRLLTSGFCWPKTLDLVAGTPYILYQKLGKGHVVAFTGDPNYRAMYPAVQRFFFNAVFFGPGH